MELTANYGLVLPKNYVSINETEMEYVDGGIDFKAKWWGLQLTLTGRETEGLLIAIGTGSAASWLATECSAAGIVTLPAAIPFGVIAAALAVSGGLIAAANWKNHGNGISFNRFWTGQITVW